MGLNPAELRQLRADCMRLWAELADRPVPLPPPLLPRAQSLLASLIPLRETELLQTWQADTPAPGPLTRLALLDLDYDRRPELLLLDGQSRLTVFGAGDDESWQPLATANLPAEAGPVVGLEIELRRQQESVAILTTGPDGAEKLYELFFNPPNQLLLRAQPGLHSPAEQRRLCLGRRFGPPGPGLLAVAAVESRDTRALALRATPAFAQSITLPLTYRPVALTFTADTVWIADSRARISCYSLTAETLTPAPAWPEAGVTVPGQVTDLTLWPDPAAPDQWLLLVATDDRYLLALDGAGQRRAQVYLPTALTTLAPDPAAAWPRLLAVTEEGQLISLSPLRAGLVADPLPEILDVLALLPETEQAALLTRWAHGAPPEQAAAIAIRVARLCTGDPAAQTYLAGLAADPSLGDPTATIGLALAALEPYLLAAVDSQQPAVTAFLELAASWDTLRSPTLQRILNRLTAQIAARFGAEFRDQPAYRRLSESRRDGELSRALSYRQQGLESDDPAEALNLYRASLNYLGRILLRRRQAVWTFATTTAIRAAAPLAGGQRALLATQAGLLHQLDLLERQQEALVSLPDGSMPRAMTSGPLESRNHSSVVVLTDTGELLLGHTGGPNGLNLAQQVTVDDDLRCLTIIPHTPDNPPRFLAGGHAGLIQLFAQSANGRWRESQSFRVKAEWISALRVTRLDEKQPPVILAGGSRAGQRGILYRLSLAGVQEQEPLYFPGIVRDIRTIAQLNTSERLVAVICDDGYLYVMKGNGARLWQYRIGHAARSFAIHDIDNNGQPEIIVGGEDNTVLILDVNGSVHWLIPAQAPVTHVAVTEPEPNQPQLLIADMENTLQVVQVNPPNSQQEKLLFVEAERSLDLLARGLAISSLNLVRQWLEQAPTPFLRGYAFHQCANWVLDGYEEMLAPLLAADITTELPEIQRAYARALVRTATRSGRKPELVRQIVARLEELLDIPATQVHVGVAAFRKLMQPDLLRPVDLELWQPALLRAAAHQQASVQRSVLYALRALRPVDQTLMNLRPDAWQILRTILATPSDGDAWVLQDMAGLLRDIARSAENLWTLVHHVLRELPDSGLLPILGQTQPQMLDSRPLPRAIAALDGLHRATTPAEAGAALAGLATVFPEIDFSADAAISADSQVLLTTDMFELGLTAPDDLISIYEALVDGLALASAQEWLNYVHAPVTEQSLERLGRLLASTGAFGNRYLNQRFEQLMATIQRLAPDGQYRPDSLLHLIGVLRRDADLLVSIGGNRLNESRNGQDTMLAKGVAGLLWAWIQPEGLLTSWYEELTRPAEPDIQIIGARLQRQEISLTLTVRNPSQSEAIDELSLYIDQSLLYFGDLELPCQTDARTRAEGISLEPQQHTQLRLQISLDAEQVELLKMSTISKGLLQLPYSYFRPPKDWPSATFEAEVEIHITSTANLDWENDLPHTWSRISRELTEQIQLAQTDTPLLVTCPPIGRENLVEVIRQMARLTPQPPVIDLRQWLFAVYDIQREGLTIGEATWLAWLAQQIWPDANRRQLQQIRYEGAPRHFFETLAESERENSPELIIFNNWESLLFSLARGRSSWEPLDRTLRFLLAWAESAGIQLVFVGTALVERIMMNRYPDICLRCSHIACDRPNLADTEGWEELVATFSRMLAEVGLLGELRRFEPAISVRDLVALCGGYLHMLDQLVIPALRALRRAPNLRHEPALTFLLDFAKQSNYFNSLWLWQDFYERLTLILVAHGEIPLQDRSWAEDGLTLSRDYFARSSDRKLVRGATLPAGTQLTHREVVTIRANRFFQPGDAHVRGLSPQRPAVPEWGVPGEMFLQLLRAGGGERRLRDLVNRGIVHHRQSSFVGDYYELAIPLFDAWIRDSKIWEQMLAAAQSAQPSWYPARLARDRRPDVATPRPLLFPEREPGPAYRDIAMNELQPIQWALSGKTLPFFLNFFGLSGRQVMDVGARWQALVNLAQMLATWQERPASDIGQDDAQSLFASLRRLLRFEYLDDAARVHLHNLPADSKELIAAAYVGLQSSSTVLRKEVMLLVIRDGAKQAENFKNLHSWARDWLESLQRPDVSEREGDQAYQLAEMARVLKRSVVVAVTLRGAEELRRARRAGGGGPHFVILDVPRLTELVIQATPSEALISYALDVTGRSAFTPYRLRGALRGGSSLFVGRDTELNAILGSLESEDHAILGSRRIGKTSLLANLYYRLTQPEFGREILALRINLLDSSTVDSFYAEIRRELEGRGLIKQARQLDGPPRADYSDLLDVMRQLRAEFQHPIVLLVDEIDGLYLRDRDENEERFFQFLRNMLAQSQPRLCTFIMTGFRYIYLSRLEHSSVFYNFCRFHSLLGIDRAAVALLVDLLEGFKIEIEQKQEVLGLIERGTYAIPYYVQLVCDQLLEFVDQTKRNVIGPNDVREALARDIQKLLKQELWDSLNVGGSLWGTADSEIKALKTRLALLALILAKYDHKLDPDRAHIALAPALRIFTAADTVRYLRDWAADVCPYPWAVTENEVNQLFLSLTMTLALAPSEEDRWAYVFPNDILPDVLCFHQRQDQDFDLLNELNELMEKLKKKL